MFISYHIVTWFCNPNLHYHEKFKFHTWRWWSVYGTWIHLNMSENSHVLCMEIFNTKGNRVVVYGLVASCWGWGPVVSSCERGNEPSGSLKDKFLGQLSDWYLKETLFNGVRHFHDSETCCIGHIYSWTFFMFVRNHALDWENITDFSV
jgi:hypothetical protein